MEITALSTHRVVVRIKWIGTSKGRTTMSGTYYVLDAVPVIITLS